MKQALVVASILTGAVGVFAQGSLNWGDQQTSYTIEILSPSTATPTVEQTGQTLYDVPSGSTSYTGGYIGGPNVGGASGNGTGIGPTPTSGYLGINYETTTLFTMGLYIATSQSALTTDIKTTAPLATTTLDSGANAGLYNAGPATYDSSLSVGTPIWVGIAAWYNGGGATAYDTSTVGGYVESTTTVALGGGTGVPAALGGLGLTSFSLAGTSTPEPSTIALGVIGASAFLMRLRRKN
jgi:hypothetical protein